MAFRRNQSDEENESSQHNQANESYESDEAKEESKVQPQTFQQQRKASRDRYLWDETRFGINCKSHQVIDNRLSSRRNLINLKKFSIHESVWKHKTYN